MEIEYSYNEKRKTPVYLFTKDEKNYITSGLKAEVKKLTNKLEKLINHPKNEGQVTFLEKQRHIKYDIDNLKYIIESLNTGK